MPDTATIRQLEDALGNLIGAGITAHYELSFAAKHMPGKSSKSAAQNAADELALAIRRGQLLLYPEQRPQP